VIGKDTPISELLSFYMGKNTIERQNFIIENLKVEKELTTEAV
jgi:topoisomerase-4 subunit B